MSEIKTAVIKMNHGGTYIAREGDYMITDKHTLADIMRFMVDQADIDEVICLAEIMKEAK